MIEKNDKLPYDNLFLKVTILMRCVVKDDDKLYSQLFLEYVSFEKLKI